MAEREIYRLEVNVGISGDRETTNRLSAMDRYTQRSQNRMRQLDRMEANPAVRLNDRMSSSLTKLEGKIGGFAKKAIKQFTAVAAAGAILVGGLGLGDTIQTYANFEQGMKNVQATSMATAEEMVLLTNTAKELGRTTAFSAKEASDGMNYLAMAGFKTNEIIEAMPGLLDLAAASGTDLARTSDIVSDALTAFGMSAQETTHLADVMARASSTANTNVELLGESFKYAAAPATAFGMSAEETTTALAKMADAGIKGSQAGTALRGALTRLSKPSEEAEGWLKQLGVSIADTHGNIRPFNDIMGDMRSSMSKLTQEQRQQAIATIFGQEAMSGMLAVLNTNTEDFAQYTQNLKDADGAAKEMAAMKLDSLSGQFTILKSAVEGMKIELGEKLAPYAKDFVTWFTTKIPDITAAIIGMVDRTIEFGTKAYPHILNVINILKTMMPLIAGIAAGMLALKTATIVMGAVETFMKLKTFIGTVIFAFQAVAGGAATLAEGMALIMGPVGWIALAIGALVTAFILAYRNSENFRNKIHELKDSFVDFVRPIIDSAMPVLRNMGTAFMGLANAVIPFVMSAIQLLMGIFTVLWVNVLQPLATYIASVFSNNIQTAFSVIGSVVTTIINTIAGVLNGLTLILGGISDFIVGVFTGNWQQAWAGIKSITEGVIVVIKSLFTGFIDFVKEIPGHMLEIGKNIMQGLADGIKTAALLPVNAIKNVGKGIVGGVKSVLKIHSPSRVMIEQGEFTTEGLEVGIKSRIPKLKTSVDSIHKVIADRQEYNEPQFKDFGAMTLPKAEKLQERPLFQKVIEKTRELKSSISVPQKEGKLAIAGAGGGGGATYYINIDNVDVDASNSGEDGDGEDIHEVVKTAQEEFGRKLLEALRDKV